MCGFSADRTRKRTRGRPAGPNHITRRHQGNSSETGGARHGRDLQSAALRGFRVALGSEEDCHGLSNSDGQLGQELWRLFGPDGEIFPLEGVISPQNKWPFTGSIA